MTIWQCGLKNLDGVRREVEGFLTGNIVETETPSLLIEKNA